MNPEELIQREENLLAYNGPDRVVHYQNYLLERQAESNTSRKLFSGFSDFDKSLEGLETGEVTVITGKTRNGKTLFAESWLRRLMLNGAAGCYFSFEVAASKTVEKYASWTEGLPVMRDRTHPEAAPLYLPRDLQTMNVDWILDRIEEAKLKYDCRVVVIDHLHFIVDMLTKQSMSLNIGATMRRLKMDAANRLNVAVILIAHQGMGDGKKTQENRDEEASLENIRDSSFIAQEADNVVVVFRRKDFQMGDLTNLQEPVRSRLEARVSLPDPANPYKDGFAMVRVDKARRSGAFRISKLFQKVGPWLEEV